MCSKKNKAFKDDSRSYFPRSLCVPHCPFRILELRNWALIGRRYNISDTHCQIATELRIHRDLLGLKGA